jgi:hypothetical protein
MLVPCSSKISMSITQWPVFYMSWPPRDEVLSPRGDFGHQGVNFVTYLRVKFVIKE